jgi:hypothetical protein
MPPKNCGNRAVNHGMPRQRIVVTGRNSHTSLGRTYRRKYIIRFTSTRFAGGGVNTIPDNGHRQPIP